MATDIHYTTYQILLGAKGKHQITWAKSQWVITIWKQIKLKEGTNWLESSKLPVHLFLLIFVLCPREDSISVELFTKLFFGCLQLSTWVLSTTDWWSSQHFSERNNTPLISFFCFYLIYVQFFSSSLFSIENWWCAVIGCFMSEEKTDCLPLVQVAPFTKL